MTKLAKKPGAPIKWPTATTAISSRLQESLPFLSCEEIGKKICRSHDTIRRYLAGKRDIPSSDLAKLAELAGVDPGWLLTGRDPDSGSRHESRFDPDTEILEQMQEAFARMVELAGAIQVRAIASRGEFARDWLRVCQRNVAAFQSAVDTHDRTAKPQKIPSASQPQPTIKAG